MVLALHGWTDAGAVFGPMARALADVADVIAPDMPGHGRTAWAGPAPYSYDVLLPSVLQVLDALPQLVGPGRPLVIEGHSMGAIAAARAAAARPDAVSHLVLEEPPRRAILHRRDVRKDMTWLRRLQRVGIPESIELMSRIVEWSPEELEIWASTKMDADPDALGTLREWGEPLVRTLESVTSPVTIICGRGRDSSVSGRRARQYIGACRGTVELVRLDAGHNPRRDNPAAFEGVMRQVLAGAAGTEGIADVTTVTAAVSMPENFTVA